MKIYFILGLYFVQNKYIPHTKNLPPREPCVTIQKIIIGGTQNMLNHM
jgi:hypothetical protein